MNIAEFSIRKSVITWSITLILLGAGWNSFMNNLSRLEDPEFTIKQAIITTPYPGASAEEVEKEVTDLMERAVQELGQLNRVESTSSRGVSNVKVYINEEYDKSALPQVWDELRRKVNDYQVQLPPGAGPSSVNDDFGDVYGVYLVLTGDGYTMAELKEFAKFLRRELLQVQDVKRIVLWGDRTEAVYVEMSRTKMAALGITQQDIYDALQSKNLPVDAGRIRLSPEYLTVNPTGEFTSEQQFGDLLITTREGGQTVFLRDVADIRREYVDPPKQIMRYNGKRGIALGISTVLGGNVVTMGKALVKRMEELRERTPAGMSLDVVSLQSEAVTESINGFMVNLAEAVAIVIVVLLFFMGLRSALIIGGILLLTICGTFLFMDMQNVILERISLGALIIALGMLVDNAIVVVEGMKVKIEAGEDGTKAAAEVVGQQAMPLLGATVVAIVAFAAIGTSPDDTGEYCRSLFTVILISLGLSWFTGVTTTPLITKLFIKPKKVKPGESAKDPYGGLMFRVYRGLLETCIRYRWLTVAIVVVMFLVSLWGFGFVKNMFFPNSTRPQFFAEIYFPEGSYIYDVEGEVARVEDYLAGLDGVTATSSAIGGGDLRFLLTYTPIDASMSNAVVFADVSAYEVIDGLMPKVQRHLDEMLAGSVVDVKKFRLGPGEGGKLQLRISGPDRAVLRELGDRAKMVLRESGAIGVRDQWKNKVKTVRPVMAEAQARQLGIERPDIARAVRSTFDGYQTGVYRERDELLPIIARAPEAERSQARDLQEIQIFSPVADRMIPMQQVTAGVVTEFEDANIWRRNRTTTLRVHANPSGDNLTSELLAVAKAPVEEALGADVDEYYRRQGKSPPADHTAATIPIQFGDRIPLKGRPGYFMAWGGETEDGAKAAKFLFANIPVFLGIMVLTVVFLFNAVRQPLIIWLTVPMMIIGVTVGLLVFDQPFGFMALLGLLSLSGMLIKNAIVLVDQIDLEIREGKDRYLAVVDSGVSRMRPVAMAAATTILGMIPLLKDAFFVSMAVTIMIGLAFATVLTLLIVPVLYTIFFRIPTGGGGGGKKATVGAS